MDTKALLKEAIIKELNLEDIAPGDIEDDAPLFNDGLGLDSLDAIELVVLVQRHFGINMEDEADARSAFASINALAAYIDARKS